jgi:hypothetical protein
MILHFPPKILYPRENHTVTSSLAHGTARYHQGSELMNRPRCDVGFNNHVLTAIVTNLPYPTGNLPTVLSSSDLQLHADASGFMHIQR